MTSSPPRALVAGHGDVAEGLVSAVEAIAGLGATFVALSNRDLGGDVLLATMRDLLEAHALHVVFTDLPAGSATMAARRLQRERPDLVLVCGVNLPTLLEYATHAAEDPVAAARAASERGRQCLQATGGPPDGV